MNHHRDLQIYKQRMKERKMLGITLVLAILATLIGPKIGLPWFIAIVLDLPLCCVAIFVLITTKGFAVQIQRIYNFILLSFGLILVGAALSSSGDNNISKFGGYLAPIAAIPIVACGLAAVIFYFSNTSEAWRKRGKDGIASLIQKLSHHNSFQRAHAAMLLGELGDRSAVDSLRACYALELERYKHH